MQLGKSTRRQEQLAGEELAFRLGEKRVQLGLGMEARAIHKASGSAEDVLVYFGIIDYLQVRLLAVLPRLPLLRRWCVMACCIGTIAYLQVCCTLL